MTDINLSRLNRWGEGIFTTLLIQSGRPVNLQAHLHRLNQAGHVLGLRPGINVDEAADHFSRLSHGADCVVRMEISFPDVGMDSPVVTFTARPLPNDWAELPHKGVSLLESSIDYFPPFRDVGWVKWNAFQPWAILRRELTTDYDVIVTDGNRWFETTRAGLVARQGDGWFAQQTSGLCLRSTTIDAVATWLQSTGDTMQETVFTSEFINQETSWFIANAAIGLVPVHSIRRRDGAITTYPVQNQPALEFRTWYLNQ